jgi:hypothetical protein
VHDALLLVGTPFYNEAGKGEHGEGPRSGAGPNRGPLAGLVRS